MNKRKLLKLNKVKYFLLFLIVSTLVAETSYKLSWFPHPENEGHVDFGGYVVYSGTNGSGEYNERFLTTTTNTLVISNRLVGQTYYYAVAAISKDGLNESQLSEEVKVNIVRISIEETSDFYDWCEVTNMVLNFTNNFNQKYLRIKIQE